MGIKSFMGKRAEPEKPAEVPMLVRDYMTEKLITFRENENIMDVVEKLIKHGISGGCVVNDRNELLGIISEGDCMKQISNSRYYNQPLENMTVEHHMATDVETIDGDMNVFDAADKFLSSRRRRFPIIQHGKLIGLISQKDILKAAIELKSHSWK